MAYLITDPEHILIDNVPLATPAWVLENLEQLYQGPDTRGQDRILPGAAGVRPYRRRATVTRRTLNVAIFGDVNWEGTPYPDPRIGIMTNIDHLRTNVTDPVTVGDGTRQLDVVMPDGDVRSARIHVEGFQLAAINWFSTRSTIDITIVSGVIA